MWHSSFETRAHSCISFLSDLLSTVRVNSLSRFSELTGSALSAGAQITARRHAPVSRVRVAVAFGTGADESKPSCLGLCCRQSEKGDRCR